MRNVSAPQRSTYSSGLTTLPRDFDILAPSLMIMPWARNRANGSSNDDEAEVVQRHRDEARVHQVEHGVLVAADVGGDRAASVRVSAASNATSSRSADG